MVIAIADGIDRFTAVAEFTQCFTDVLQGRLIRPGKIIQLQYHTGDVFIIFGFANGIHQVKQ
ncbi:hypothetical protein D3C77_672450 [compost metagenome]